MRDIGKEREISNISGTSSTPYDDVFHTLLNDCSQLIIPVINEVFHESYKGNETITFHANEHYINSQDTKLEKRVTDNCFVIHGETKKNYHIECQSTSDSSMLVRMFEYGAQIALDEGKTEKNVLEVEFPHSAVLFLRSTKNTPDKMKICMKTPGGDVSYDIPVMKIKEYSLQKIFERNLLFLIPFYIFNHENRLEEYNTNPERLEILRKEYGFIRNSLEQLCTEYKINAYTRFTITKMSRIVVENLLRKYENVKEGVNEVMGGKLLDYEEKRIWNEGIEQGREEGREEGMEELIENMILENMTISIIVKISKMPEERVRGIKDKMIKEGKLKE